MSKKNENRLGDHTVKIPEAYDIECAVLGAMMLGTGELDIGMKDFTVDLFFSEKHQIIAESIIELYKAGTAIDILVVTNHIREKNLLEKVQGAYYITMLTNRVASQANIEFHIKILQQMHLRRKLISVASKIIKDGYDMNNDIFEVYSESQSSIDDSLNGVLNYSSESVATIHDQNVEDSMLVQNNDGVSGVQTGLRALDKLTNGWQKTDLIIIAGRPGMGKTASAITLAMNAAIHYKRPIGIFSLEMSKYQLVGRMESSLSGLDVSKIVKKQLTYDEIIMMDAKCKPLKEAPIYIDDTPNISLIELRSKARRMQKENGIEMIVIDYLQLMRSGLDIGNREQEVSEISRGLKALAKELNIPIIALSQLSRTVESSGDKKPLLSHLRDSGAIEQDADMVIFCFRPEYYGIEDYEIDGRVFDANGLFMFIVAKHRNGGVGEIPLSFIRQLTKIVNHGEDVHTSSIVGNVSAPEAKVEASPVIPQPIDNKTLQSIGANFLNNKPEDDMPF